jgi:hypothetical protein
VDDDDAPGGEMRAGFVPTLDGARLKQGDAGELWYADGRPVEEERLDDVVYVNAQQAERRAQLGTTGWWRALDEDGPAQAPPTSGAADVRVGDVVFTPDDVSSMLIAIGDAHRPAPPVETVDAGFFHRTLVRWMGEDDGDDSPSLAPRWDYDFWKAELHLEGKLDRAMHARARGVEPGGPGVVKSWTAEVWRGESTPPRRYRYWVAFDDGGRVAESGWLSDAPDLLGESEPGAGFAGAGPDLATLAAALAEAD